MSKIKMSLLAALSFAAVSFSAQADQTTLCTHGDQERKISVVYKVEGQKAPCEVVYEKAEGIKTLWSAQAQEGYCEEKASAFVAKQEGWGWSCTAQQ